MGFFILTKKKLAFMGVCAISFILILVVSIQGLTAVTSVAAQPKKIPIYCVKKDEKVISISFDAAWGNEQTTELLNILKQHDIKSTFFLVGDWVDKYPESVKEIADAGHDVCNHSDTHPHMPQLSSDKMKEQIEKCNNKIESITGTKPLLFRPPYGDYNNAVVDMTNSCGMYCIQWDVDSLDWKDPTPEEMKKRVTSRIKPGSIVLFHNGAKNTPKALGTTIDAIIADGYKIVPISQLIYQGEYTTDHEGKQCPNQ